MFFQHHIHLDSLIFAAWYMDADRHGLLTDPVLEIQQIRGLWGWLMPAEFTQILGDQQAGGQDQRDKHDPAQEVPDKQQRGDASQDNRDTQQEVD